MRGLSSSAVVALALTLVAACAPRTDVSAPVGAGVAPTTTKVVTVGPMREPVAIESFHGGISGAVDIRAFLHSYLTEQNYRDETIPRLAAELPAVDRGTWVVNPDGTMDVTWRLRSNVKWHD